MFWTRVRQISSPEHCTFGTPIVKNGQKLAANEFLKGDKLSFDSLVLPVLRPGKIHAISMALGAIPIVNEIAAPVFEEVLGTDVQLIECAPVNEQSLWVANILSVLDCLDRAHTKAEYYPTNYPLKHLSNCVNIAFELVIRRSVTTGHPVFRIKEDNVKLIVASTFLEIMTARCLDGLEASDFPRYRAEGQ